MSITDATTRVLISRHLDLGYVCCQLPEELAELLLTALIWYSRYKHLLLLRALCRLLDLFLGCLLL